MLVAVAEPWPPLAALVLAAAIEKVKHGKFY